MEVAREVVAFLGDAREPLDLADRLATFVDEIRARYPLVTLPPP